MSACPENALRQMLTGLLQEVPDGRTGEGRGHTDRPLPASATSPLLASTSKSMLGSKTPYGVMVLQTFLWLTPANTVTYKIPLWTGPNLFSNFIHFYSDVA